MPKDPALCLVCGAFVCLKGVCCKQQGICECVLVSFPTIVPFLSSSKHSLWGSACRIDIAACWSRQLLANLFSPPHTCHFVALPTLWRCDRHLSTDKCFSHHHHPWTSFLSVGLCLPWCTRRGRSGFTVRRVTPSHTFLLIDSIESLEQLFKYTYNTWCDSSMNLNVVPPLFFPHSCFPPSGMFPVVASLSTYVRSGIECWSNSGFHTPLITSTSVGGLIIMDSKIFQSPLKNHIPWWRRFFFSFVFFRDFFSFWLMCLPWSKYLETLAVINTNIQRGLFLLQPWFMWSLVYSHA